MISIVREVQETKELARKEISPKSNAIPECFGLGLHRIGVRLSIVVPKLQLLSYRYWIMGWGYSYAY